MANTTSHEGSVRLFTVKEAATALNLPTSWIYERTRKNAIPCRRFGKYVRFTGADLQAIIAAAENGSADHPENSEA